MDNGDCGISEACEHRRGTSAFWIRNDGVGAPVVFLSTTGGLGGDLLLTLTNQKLYLRCPACFERLRSGLTKLTPGR